MNMLLLLFVFAAPIVWGAAVGGFRWVRDRRRMTAAFARGRAESVVRLPAVVEPMPVLERAA